MAQLSTLNETNSKKIFDLYDLSKTLNYKLLTGGSENTNYKIKTSNATYVLTICEQKSKPEALNLARLLVYLNENGFPTSEVVSNKKGALISEFEGKPILLKKYIHGTVTSTFSNAQMAAIGKQLAKLNRIQPLDFIPTQVGYGIQHFTKVETHSPNAPFCKWLMETKDYISQYRTDALPKALTHSDLFWSNIIIDTDTDEVTIMDLEEATYYYRIFDIGMTLVGTCNFDRQLNLEKAKQLLSSYQKHFPLSLNEKKSLQAFTVYAAAATGFWRYMNFNFVAPDETQKDRYKEMQDLATQIRSIDPEQFLKIL